MSDDPRWIAGKHLTLTSEKLLSYIARIPGITVPSFALWRDLCFEARELIAQGLLPQSMLYQVAAVENYLRESLSLGVSVDGKGRDELVRAIQTLEEHQLHKDAGMAYRQTDETPKRGLMQ